MGMRKETRASLRFKGVCECCANRNRLAFFVSRDLGESIKVPGTDLHEIVRKGNIPKKLQDVLFMRGNCLFLCRECHQDAPWAIHGTPPELWAIPLLLLVRTKEEVTEFIDAYRATFKLDHPFVRAMEWALVPKGVFDEESKYLDPW